MNKNNEINNTNQITPESIPAVESVTQNIMSTSNHNNAVSIPSVAPPEFNAANQGWQKSPAYGAMMAKRYSNTAAMAAMLQLRQRARQRAYHLDELFTQPQKLLAALDEYDNTILELGIMPTYESLSIWLNTRSTVIRAISSSQTNSDSAEILRAHNDFMAAAWVASAETQEKPLFSIFWLKSQSGYIENAGNINVNITSLPAVAYSTTPDALQTAAELYITTDSQDNSSPENRCGDVNI